MCGFFSIVNNSRLSISGIPGMFDVLNNRGPDGRGLVEWKSQRHTFTESLNQSNAEIIQGHTRLSILDISEAGKQPMLSGCGRYSLTYNGEIYNYLELKIELESLGYQFVSSSDTEVLLNALIEWGEQCLHKLQGMFAFSFYDSVTREMIVARDGFGIKPFYYAAWEGGIAFSSLAEVLLQLPGVGSAYTDDMEYSYLIGESIDSGEDSIYKDIKFLPAGTFIKFNTEELSDYKIKPFWNLKLQKPLDVNFEQAVQKVRELFLESIELHLRSDVPIGVALSGGIDSSAIICAMRYLRPEQEIHAFSYIADEGLSEEQWIDIVNDHCKSIPHKIYSESSGLERDLEDLVRTQAEPFVSTSIYAQYLVFKEAHNSNLKVMLDGQGADEILAGYSFYRPSRLASLLRSFQFIKSYSFLDRGIQSCNFKAGSKSNVFVKACKKLVPAQVVKILGKISSPMRLPWISQNYKPENHIVNPKDKGSKEFLKQHMLNTLKRDVLPQLLRYEDKNSMRFSIESRVPFLYIPLVEYLYSLPEDFLMSNEGVTKHVFREAMRGIVPDSILDRKDKVGFATPELSWLKFMNNLILREVSNDTNVVLSSEFQSYWQAVFKGDKPYDSSLWRTLNLELSKRESRRFV